MSLEHELAKTLISVTFKEAPRNRVGNMVLRRVSVMWVFPFVGFLLGLFGAVMSLFVEESAEEKALNVYLYFIVLFLGILFVAMKISRSVVSNDGVSTYRIWGKKYIRFDSIESASYTRLFSGCLVLKGQGNTLRVPMDTYGFSQFYEMLKEKIGTDKIDIGKIGTELIKRKKMAQ